MAMNNTTGDYRKIYDAARNETYYVDGSGLVIGIPADTSAGGHTHWGGSPEPMKHWAQSAFHNREIPREYFNREHLAPETMLELMRNRLVLRNGKIPGCLTDKHRQWLLENTTDIYVVGEYEDEIMFLSRDDMTLFVLSL